MAETRKWKQKTDIYIHSQSNMEIEYTYIKM